MSRPTRRVLCPECGRIAVDEVVWEDGNIRDGSYLCPLGHQFLMRWTHPPPEQKAS